MIQQKKSPYYYVVINVWLRPKGNYQRYCSSIKGNRISDRLNKPQGRSEARPKPPDPLSRMMKGRENGNSCQTSSRQRRPDSIWGWFVGTNFRKSYVIVIFNLSKKFRTGFRKCLTKWVYYNDVSSLHLYTFTHKPPFKVIWLKSPKYLLHCNTFSCNTIIPKRDYVNDN